MRSLPPVTSSGRPSKTHKSCMLHWGKPAAPRALDITLHGPFYAGRAPKYGNRKLLNAVTISHYMVQ
jgi:hypothetical protein